MTITTMGAPPADEPLDAVIARMEAAMAKDAGVGTKAAAYWNADVQRLIDAARRVAAPVEGEAGEIVGRINTYLFGLPKHGRTYYATHPEVMLTEAAALITSLSARLADAERKRDEAVAAEREAIIAALPGGQFCDPQEIADMIRTRTAAPATTTEGGEA